MTHPIGSPGWLEHRRMARHLGGASGTHLDQGKGPDQPSRSPRAWERRREPGRHVGMPVMVPGPVLASRTVAASSLRAEYAALGIDPALVDLLGERRQDA